jgi:hypothetical protein
VISDGVSLSDKLRRTFVAMRGFVSEDGAVDAFLLRDRVVDELAPDEHGVGIGSPKNDVLSGADELSALASVCVSVAAVVPLVEFEAVTVAVFRHPPEWFHSSRSVIQ